MIGDVQRYSESARRAFTWALLAALKEKSEEIGPVHLLAGIHQEKPGIFRGTKLSRSGLTLPKSSFADLSKLVREAGHSPGPHPTASSGSEMMGAKMSPSPTLKRAMKIAVKYSEKLGKNSTGVVHLLWGVFQADASLRHKLERAGLKKSDLESLCKRYKDGDEGESGADMMEKMRPRPARCGIGYDLHRLAPGRPLILGGIEVPFEKGPIGHSDGDALAHAICDALLGAAGLGDIGTHFPDTDPKWKGVSSLLFLENVSERLTGMNLRISHVDAVVITEKPQLGPHFPAMRKALAKALAIEPDRINLKAKTNEGVDAIGRGEAIAAQAIATLEG
jgi:2-C-methyl-D-erythritol 2,4-cyclodiphosphate synthase